MNEIERELRNRFAGTEARLTGPDFAPSGAPSHLLRRTRRRQVGVAAVALLVVVALVFGAVTSVASLVRSQRRTPAELTPKGPVTVTVSVSGIKGEAGSQLAGILFKGHEISYPNNFQPVGGFTASVGADPFSTTQIVHQAAPYSYSAAKLGPVTTAVLHVEPGTYTIALYVGPKLRPIPWGRWRPFGTPGLKGCEMSFVVDDGTGSMVVRMHDPALADMEWGPRGPLESLAWSAAELHEPVMRREEVLWPVLRLPPGAARSRWCGRQTRAAERSLRTASRVQVYGRTVPTGGAHLSEGGRHDAKGNPGVGDSRASAFGVQRGYADQRVPDRRRQRADHDPESVGEPHPDRAA